MSKRRGLDREAGGRLSQEDAALWEHVTQDVEPDARMERVRRRRRIVKASVDPTLTPASTGPPKMADMGARAQSGQMARETKPAAVVKPAPRAAPHGDIDPRLVKKVGRGRRDIEARIDLHGMTQVEAHGELVAFLWRVQAQGKRLVLVITGKGRRLQWGSDRPSDDWGDLPVHESRQRGVLQRMVPVWLTGPELRGIVVGHAQASLKHGGEGAIYVQLKSR